MSQAIVISTTKYAENDVIANCLLKEEGTRSFLLRGIFKNKRGRIKPAHFQPLMQLDIEINPYKKNKKSLGYLKNVRVKYPYQTIHTNPMKQSILFFITELLKKIMQAEQQPNKMLFDYITNALKWLDLNENITHFHLIFMIKLTGYLGFFPNTKNINEPFFDPYLGGFKINKTSEYCWNENQTTAFKKLLQCDFESPSNVLRRKDDLTNLLCNYFKLHIPGFQTPKSISVLKILLR